MAHFWSVVLTVTCVKLLFIPAYRSTDFEVHHNWLAITHSLPVSKWYFESTSKWTLDYPPLFAWFEYLLSLVAKFVDPGMLQITNLNYDSQATVIFQRLSVIVSDCAFIYAVWVWRKLFTKESWLQSKNDPWFQPVVALTMLFLWNPGLLMVDHIHFQYNGLLFGILLLAIARIFQNRCVEAAFWFSVLLNMKHLYLYVAPAFFIYLLRSYCFSPLRKGAQGSLGDFRLSNFLKLALTVAFVFVVSLGPFLSQVQLKQLFSRLFPFKRGLCHAYWAPNVWALYAALDKFLSVAGTKLYLLQDVQTQNASMTGGLVQEFSFTVLPDIAPMHTFLLTAAFQVPALWKLWRHPNDPWIFLRTVVLCAYSSFLFGWHVHEKAVLMMILPLTPLAINDRESAKLYIILSTVGHFSLFPLLFKEAETLIKILLLLIHTVYSLTVLKRIFGNHRIVTEFEFLYLSGLGVVYLYSKVHPYLPLGSKLPFLPLLLTSVYCAFGVIYTWALSWTHLYSFHPKRKYS